MHILISLVLALVALYFWLSGHWFGRVVAFLAWAVVLGLLGSGLAGSMGPAEHNHGWIGILLGAVLAWFVSGIPLYYYRFKGRGPIRLTLH